MIFVTSILLSFSLVLPMAHARLLIDRLSPSSVRGEIVRFSEPQCFCENEWQDIPQPGYCQHEKDGMHNLMFCTTADAQKCAFNISQAVYNDKEPDCSCLSQCLP